MKYLWLRILGAILVEFLVAGVILGMLYFLGLTETVLGSYAASMLLAGVLGVLLSVLVLFYASRWGGLPLNGFGFSWNKNQALFSIAVVVLTLALAAAYMFLLDRFGFRELSVAEPQAWVILAGIIGALSIFHEEILSRGYILTMLRKYYGVALALLISSFIFMLIHIPTRGFSYRVVTWLLMGLVYGYVYLKSESLWSALAVHAAHNFSTDLLLYSGTGFAVVEFEPALGAVEQIAFRFLLSLAIVALTYYWYGRERSFLEPAPELKRRWAQA